LMDMGGIGITKNLGGGAWRKMTPDGKIPPVKVCWIHAKLRA